MMDGYLMYPCMGCPYLSEEGYEYEAENDLKDYSEDVEVKEEAEDSESMYRRPPFYGPRPPFYGPRPPFYGPRPPFYGPRPPFFYPPRPYFIPPYPVPGPFYGGFGFGAPFLTGLALGGLLF